MQQCNSYAARMALEKLYQGCPNRFLKILFFYKTYKNFKCGNFRAFTFFTFSSQKFQIY